MIALTRAVSPSLAACELTHLERTPIDAERAARQHAAYEDCLRALGCDVIRVGGPPDPALPDSVFIEDTAIVLREVAFALRPGAASRRPEVDAVAEALAAHRTIERMPAPATMDGGDVLRLGRRLYVGLSSRTNAAGIAWLRERTSRFGYEVIGVPVRGVLHLKSAATAVAEDVVLVDPALVDPECFTGAERIAVDPAEPGAANALRVRDALVVASAFPRTAERLEARGYDVHRVELSELARAEGAVTCCSILIEESE